MAAYGSIAGVGAFVRHVTFDAPNAPTSAEVETWLTARAAQLTAWLAAAGYATPVTQAEAKAILDRYANIGAAGDVELSLRSGGYSADGEDARENKFLAEFAKAEAWIAGDALAALGVPRTPADATVSITFAPASYRGADATDEYGRGVWDA